MRSALDPNLSFSEAAALWLDNHRDHIKPRTASDYEQYIGVLRKFGLTADAAARDPYRHLRRVSAVAEDEPEARRRQPAHQSGAELPLADPRPGRPVERHRALLPATAHAEVEAAAGDDSGEGRRSPAHRGVEQELGSRALRAGAHRQLGIGPGEMRAIQLEHLRLDAKVIYVAAGDDGDKNPFRIAPMALNEPALAALEVLVARYKEICRKQGIAERGDHFLFPKRVKKGTYDPTQMASSSFIRSALREIRAVAGMPKLRHYDFRHQIITSLLEIPGVSTETVQAVARHKVGTRTIEHYSKIRIQAKQQALDLLNEHRRAAALRRPPQRENTDAAPLAQAAKFCRESRLSTEVTKKGLDRVPESCKSSDTQGKF
jgi:integrase